MGDQIIRGLVQRPRKKNNIINIWSAGCSSGEEPYSIAILIDQLFPHLNGWDITILGTDINPDSIKKAKNGFELTKKIRDDQSRSETPVILVTNLDSRVDRERGIDAGADAYIVKSSFDRSNLLDVIARLI